MCLAESFVPKRHSIYFHSLLYKRSRITWALPRNPELYFWDGSLGIWVIYLSKLHSGSRSDRKGPPSRESKRSRKKQQRMSFLPCVLFSPSWSCRVGGGVATKLKEGFLWYFTERQALALLRWVLILSLYTKHRSMHQTSEEVSGSNVGRGKFSLSQQMMLREGHLSLWFLSFKPCEKQQQSQDIRDKSV